MTPTDLLTMIQADGARLTLTPAGRLRLTGPDVERWLPVLGQYERELVDVLLAPVSADTAGAGVIPGSLAQGPIPNNPFNANPQHVGALVRAREGGR